MITRAVAITNSVESDSVKEGGNNESKTPGTGFEPMTLSTAIANGIGASNERGVARRPIKKIPTICFQNGRVLFKRSWYRARSLYFTGDNPSRDSQAAPVPIIEKSLQMSNPKLYAT